MQSPESRFANLIKLLKDRLDKRFKNIECRDAVLAWDRVENVMDEHGVPVSRWDGVTMKTHPVTGEQVPDENSRQPLQRYINPRRAEWPQADYIVGNPPFIGNKRMRDALGDGYVEALRTAWSLPSTSGRGGGGEGGVPESADLVMFWWQHAAQLVARGELQRFGLITTNSLKQTFNRRVVENALKSPVIPANATKGDTKAPRHSGLDPESSSAPLALHSLRSDSRLRGNDGLKDAPSGGGFHLAFAIPDHPWVDSADGGGDGVEGQHRFEQSRFLSFRRGIHRAA